jgi:hypothetical protein
MVVQVRRADFEGDESWERVTDEEDLLGVSAGWHVSEHAGGGWLVCVSVMEFIREEPLEGEMRRRIAAALRSVGGVTGAVESDREIWWVTGSCSGEDLVRAVSAVLDDLSCRTRASYYGPAR